MKAGTIIDTIERFFLDIIGSVLPGACLFVGIWILFRQYPLTPLSIPPDGSPDWLILIGLSYLLGHFVAGVEAVAIRFLSCLKRVPGLNFILPSKFKPTSDLLSQVRKSRDMETFVNLASPFVPWLSETDNNVVHPARSLAISLAPAGEARVFRFMFLSLLTFGTASALLLTLLIWAVLSLAVSVRLLDASLVYPFHWAWFFVWLTVAFVVAERGFTFRSITLRVPFSMASIAVLQGALEKAEKVQPRTKLAPPPRLYLAGGFYSGWQDRIAQVWSGSLVDPRAHNLQDENQYTFWDLEAIRTCDWILAHIEASNPGGYALALEVGFAKALGKRVILVDEKSDGDDRLRRHMGMIHACADLTFDDLDEVVGFLESLRFLRFVEEPDEVQRPRE